MSIVSLDTWQKLNVHKTFSRRIEHVLSSYVSLIYVVFPEDNYYFPTHCNVEDTCAVIYYQIVSAIQYVSKLFSTQMILIIISYMSSEMCHSVILDRTLTSLWAHFGPLLAHKFQKKLSPKKIIIFLFYWNTLFWALWTKTSKQDFSQESHSYQFEIVMP